MYGMNSTENPIKDVMARAATHGYTMADVCRVAEISQTQVSRWISGRVDPLYGTVARLNQVVDAMVAAKLEIESKRQEGQP